MTTMKTLVLLLVFAACGASAGEDQWVVGAGRDVVLPCVGVAVTPTAADCTWRTPLPAHRFIKMLEVTTKDIQGLSLAGVPHGPCDLRIVAAAAPHQGAWQCMTTLSRGQKYNVKVQDVSSPVLRYNDNVYINGDKIKLPAPQRHLFSCHVDAKPAASVRWLHDDKDVSLWATVENVEQGTAGSYSTTSYLDLCIKGPGVLSCLVEHSSTPAPQRLTINIETINTNTEERCTEPAATYKDKMEAVVLQCGEESPTPSSASACQWLTPLQAAPLVQMLHVVEERYPGLKPAETSNNPCNLLITALGDQEQGIWKCVVEGQVQQGNILAIATHILTIMSMGMPTEEDEIILHEDEMYHANCSVWAVPAPTSVSWLLNGHTDITEKATQKTTILNYLGKSLTVSTLQNMVYEKDDHNLACVIKHQTFENYLMVDKSFTVISSSSNKASSSLLLLVLAVATGVTLVNV